MPEFPPSAKRTAFALQLNVAGMCERFGIDQIGFLTLTFADHVLDPREAQRRMNSLTTNVLRPRYGSVIRVIERQKSGRIHYHLLVPVGADIRSGCDFDAFARGDYRSAPPALRAEWAFWRRTAKAYGFGRTELLPVRSTSEAMGRYVGKYIGKHIGKREERDKGVRMVSYSGPRIASTRFAWAGGRARDWRRRLRAFVQMLYESDAIYEPTLRAMADRFGPRWAWYWRDSIMSFPLENEHGEAGGDARASGGAQALSEGMVAAQSCEACSDPEALPREQGGRAEAQSAGEVSAVGGAAGRGADSSDWGWRADVRAPSLAMGITQSISHGPPHGHDEVMELPTSEVRL